MKHSHENDPGVLTHDCGQGEVGWHSSISAEECWQQMHSWSNLRTYNKYWVEMIHIIMNLSDTYTDHVGIAQVQTLSSSYSKCLWAGVTCKTCMVLHSSEEMKTGEKKLWLCSNTIPMLYCEVSAMWAIIPVMILCPSLPFCAIHGCAAVCSHLRSMPRV